ncbi:MAG TPA: GatB/YqeY domain-containing protein [Marinagarivorans sp.]|nr:GatB/YqeY domain-containing protein [Cellvibrionaceae bacterium]HMY39492.1 GatB/YqeY domain-containing protein [Marinagarivorans sp.]HNG61585.1 GatB/YqeY domain-containing protein [Cellvibrionaceae bacterium]
MSTEIKQRVNAAVKDAMRAQAKDRLGVLRLIAAEYKKVEVDERIEVDDARALQLLDKMVKQRRDSVSQFIAGGRPELAEKETFEISVIQEFLPQSLSDEELVTLIKEAIAETGAASAQDMGKLMAIIKPKAQGRCDMSKVSQLIKAQFA